MSDNKLDFRKMKLTQFDPGQVMKGSFSELKSGLRTIQTTTILNDAYTHFVQELNVDNKPTKVDYYQAVDPARDRVTVTADNAGSLAGKYFTLQEFITKKVHVFWYEVSGVGPEPMIGDVRHRIVIQTNDIASVVAYATKLKIKQTEEFVVIGNNPLAAFIDIEYYQFGETEAVDIGTSGFLTSRIKEGQSIYVGGVEIGYDVEGSPIYNGNLLKGFLYNPYTTEFVTNPAEITLDNITVDLSPLISKDPQIYNVNMPVAGTEYNLVLPLDTKRFEVNIRDSNCKYTLSYVSGGPVMTFLPGVVYSEQGLKLEATNNTIYFTAVQNNKVMEIITWK